MSKEAGFVVPPENNLPSAPPSYEEAIQASAPMPQPYPVPPPMNPHQMYMDVNEGFANQLPVNNFYPSVPQGPATIIVTLPVGRERCNMRCPKCNAVILTETVEEAHGLAHACCCLLFAIGCFICSCLPYCMDSCKTVKHRCPNCKAQLGTYSPY